MEQVRVQKRGQSLDKEIEKQQQWSDCQQDGSTIDAAARGPGQATYETGRASLTGDFFPKAVEFGGNGVANDAAANRTKLVVHPDRDIEAISPEQNSSAYRYGVAKNCKQTQRGPGAPNHKTSRSLL